MLSAGAVPVLTAQLLHPTSSDLLLRSNIASTLLQIYRFCPLAPRLPGAEDEVKALLLRMMTVRVTGRRENSKMEVYTSLGSCT